MVFGRILRDESGKVTAIREDKDCSEAEKSINEVNSGIYILKRELLESVIGEVNTDNSQGEFYLTDIIELSSKHGKNVQSLNWGRPSDLAGANNRLELSQLELIRRLEITSELLLQGVSIQDKTQVFIDENVSVGKDSFLGAGTHLLGNTKIGEGVFFEGYSRVEDSQIDNGVRIKLSCHIEESTVGVNSQVGPFAHLRPGSKLGENVKVGNFVETKKAELKDGVKAGHLSYLGDATISEDANIGAGTITCNYDGKNKHKTTVGKDSFIGSNSCLVAPVNIGDKAYIAAGSVITKDVPDKALGVGRARQTNKDNYNKD